jgi:hypothetical protein
MLMLAEEQWMEKIPMNSDAWTGHHDAIHCNSKQRNEYWLLLVGGVEQSVPNTAAIFWTIVHPHLSSNTPDSSISALWLYQRHLAVTQGGSKKCP